jgi:hypothetical protein
MPDRVVTKAEFARLLDLSPARVSQYLAAGMPVRRDGRLYLRRSLKWVRAKYPLWRINWYDRGVWRADRILKNRPNCGERLPAL